MKFFLNTFGIKVYMLSVPFTFFLNRKQKYLQTLLYILILTDLASLSNNENKYLALISFVAL